MAKSYLSPSDKERIERELKEIRSRRQATGDVAVGSPQPYRPPEVEIDDGQLAAREAKLKGILERESPPVLSPTNRNSAYAEFKGLLREFEDNALTKYDQGLGYPEIMKRSGPQADGDFERAKKKCVAWEMGPRGVQVTHRIKELAGVLDPSNPELRNLEHYRRRK